MPGFGADVGLGRYSYGFAVRVQFFGVRVLRKWCRFTNRVWFGPCFGCLFAKLRHLRDLFRLAHPVFSPQRPSTRFTSRPPRTPYPPRIWIQPAVCSILIGGGVSERPKVNASKAFVG